MDWQSEDAAELLHTLIGKPRLGLVTGMDGTLSPITDEWAGTPPSRRCQTLLAALAERLPLVAVLSARPALDLRYLINLPSLVYLGGRGLETWEGGRRDIAPEAAAFRQALESAMSGLYGSLGSAMQVEDAGSAVLVHFAESDSEAAQVRTFVQELADQQGLRFFEGRRVFELRPPMLVDKGRALQRLVEHYALDGVVYLGNDVSDVDAFNMTHALRAQGTCFGIAVCVLSEWTATEAYEEADLTIDGFAGVEIFLDWLYRNRQVAADS